MTFNKFCGYLEKIEITASRNEMTGLLVRLIKEADKNEVDKVVYLALGEIAPLYRAVNFNLADKLMVRAIALAFDKDAAEVEKDYKKTGDLGEVAVIARSPDHRVVGDVAICSQTRLPRDVPDGTPLAMTVNQVFSSLSAIAYESGLDSQERKLEKTADLLKKLDPLGAKFAVRIILGKLRLGFSDKTILDALSFIVSGDKSSREKIEAAYNVRPDVGWIASQISNFKFQISNLRAEPVLGTPVIPALCQRLPGTEEIIEKMCRPSTGGRSRASTSGASTGGRSRASTSGASTGGRSRASTSGASTGGRSRASTTEGSGVFVEPKYDGQRLQAHVSVIAREVPAGTSRGNPVSIHLFTRSLEDVTPMFPDLTEALSVNMINKSRHPEAYPRHPNSSVILSEELRRVEGSSEAILISRQPLDSSTRRPAQNDGSMILDGEVVGIDPKTGKAVPFQTMITRKRKYGVAENLLKVPIRYIVFDILELNGESLIQKPFYERRKILENVIARNPRRGNLQPDQIPTPRAAGLGMTTSLAPQIVSSDPIEIRTFLKQQIDKGLEGIVAKKYDSPYSPGRTGFHWVKLKWEGEAKAGGLLDTVDCVVMGIYSGKGKRSGFGAGAFLVGIANSRPSVILSEESATSEGSGESANDTNIDNASARFFAKPQNDDNSIQNDVTFQTISKIGTGLSDEQWKQLKVKSEKLKVKKQPVEYVVPKGLTPDVWMRPELVAEIQADNITKSPLHSAGYALRFPRLVRYRDDKKTGQATTREEIEKLYEMQ